MKAYLMYPDRDLDLEQPLPFNEEDLVQDLELTTLWNAMARGDKFLYRVARHAILTGLKDPEEICYRQEILQDCISHPEVIREMYQIPIEAMENKRKNWMGIFTYYPSGILSSSIEMMEMFLSELRKLRKIAEEHGSTFTSRGFKAFFETIQKELDDNFFMEAVQHLKALKFRQGVLLGARLGMGNEGMDYVLLKIPEKKRRSVSDIFLRKKPVYSFYISERDDASTRALSELKDRGINLVANALAQSADHVDSFFRMLQTELAFYIGCLNLYEKLKEMGCQVAFPSPAPMTERKHSFRGLYDICLALTMKQKVVGNDVRGDGKELVIITGANQGGKSTFLRSIGLAQLMMECGMFVPADEFSANVCVHLFTHFKRKEDASMKSGKLDEELSRMSDIVDHLIPHSIVLFNESFASTNEREGSEIGRQITSAFLERHIKVFFVTHFYEFAHHFYIQRNERFLFLRAERKSGGKRTFKLIEGEPLPTSFGEDIYTTVFGSTSPAPELAAQEMQSEKM